MNTLDALDDAEFITPPQIAQKLRVDHTTVLLWIHSGKLRAKRVGGRWRINPADLEAFLAQPVPQTGRPRGSAKE